MHLCPAVFDRKKSSLCCMVLTLEPLLAVFAAGVFVLPAANFLELEPIVNSFVVGFKFVAYIWKMLIYASN